MENKSNKDAIIIILLVVLLLAVIGGLVWYYMSQNNTNKVEMPQNNNEQTLIAKDAEINSLKSEIEAKDKEITELKGKIDALLKEQGESAENTTSQYIRNYSIKNGNMLYIDKEGYLYLSDGTKIENIKPSKVFFEGYVSKSIAIVGEDERLYVIEDIFNAKITKPLGDSKIKNIKYGTNGMGVTRTVFTSESGKNYDFANGDYVINRFQTSNDVYEVQVFYEEATLAEMEKPRG